MRTLSIICGTASLVCFILSARYLMEGYLGCSGVWLFLLALTTITTPLYLGYAIIDILSKEETQA